MYSCGEGRKSLRELLPAFWEQKGHMHPAGLFVSRTDRDYVAMRVDVSGVRPYEVLYHEYIHLLVRLNFERIPVWANEGLAEFWGNTDIDEKEVTLGNFSLGRLRQMRENNLLPLDVLLSADEHSPYYNEENKVSIFYAESWALVHFLLLGNNRARSNQLSEYLTLVLNKHMDSVAAARQAFGDLGHLSKELSSYAGQETFGYLKMKSPAQLQDKDFPTRELSQAESLAVRGDFHAHMERPAEARAMLDQALALEPNLAAAHESIGVLALYAGKWEQAAESFARAAELDSTSYLAQYYAALAAMQSGKQGGGLDQAETRLKRAIELNPEFAESYSTLARLYVLRADKLDQALQLAQKAADLEPGNFTHWINIGFVLLRMRRTAEARSFAEKIMGLARKDSDREAVQAYQKQVESQAQYEQRQSERQQEMARPGKAAEQGGSSNGGIPLTHRPGTAAAPTPGPPVNVIGKIETVRCQEFRLELTLAAPDRKLMLHIENYYRLELETVNWEPPPNFNPCHDLEGLDARVVYVALKDSESSGVLVTVEVRGSGKK